MTLMGYGLALVAIALLYKGSLIFGGLIFVAGGVLARKMSLSVRSAGLILLVMSLAYGHHYLFSPIVIFFAVVGLILATFNSLGSDGGSDWGGSVDLSDFGGDSGGGDGGGCDGGGGD